MDVELQSDLGAACWTIIAISSEEDAASEAMIGIAWPSTPAFAKRDLPVPDQGRALQFGIVIVVRREIG